MVALDFFCFLLFLSIFFRLYRFYVQCFLFFSFFFYDSFLEEKNNFINYNISGIVVVLYILQNTVDTISCVQFDVLLYPLVWLWAFFQLICLCIDIIMNEIIYLEKKMKNIDLSVLLMIVYMNNWESFPTIILLSHILYFPYFPRVLLNIQPLIYDNIQPLFFLLTIAVPIYHLCSKSRTGESGFGTNKNLPVDMMSFI